MRSCSRSSGPLACGRQPRALVLHHALSPKCNDDGNDNDSMGSCPGAGRSLNIVTEWFLLWVLIYATIIVLCFPMMASSIPRPFWAAPRPCVGGHPPIQLVGATYASPTLRPQDHTWSHLYSPCCVPRQPISASADMGSCRRWVRTMTLTLSTPSVTPRLCPSFHPSVEPPQVPRALQCATAW